MKQSYILSQIGLLLSGLSSYLPQNYLHGSQPYHQQPMFSVQRENVPKNTPNTGLICALWIFTAMSACTMMSSGPSGFGLAFMLDIPAFIIAIVLACSRNSADKANGWVKIVLEIIAFISVSSMQRPQ